MQEKVKLNESVNHHKKLNNQRLKCIKIQQPKVEIKVWIIIQT
jgi:hypothetical protein